MHYIRSLKNHKRIYYKIISLTDAIHGCTNHQEEPSVYLCLIGDF